jgi:hypothetical protein
MCFFTVANGVTVFKTGKHYTLNDDSSSTYNLFLKSKGNSTGQRPILTHSLSDTDSGRHLLYEISPSTNTDVLKIDTSFAEDRKHASSSQPADCEVNPPWCTQSQSVPDIIVLHKISRLLILVQRLFICLTPCRQSVTQFNFKYQFLTLKEHLRIYDIATTEKLFPSQLCPGQFSQNNFWIITQKEETTRPGVGNPRPSRSLSAAFWLNPNFTEQILYFY